LADDALDAPGRAFAASPARGRAMNPRLARRVRVVVVNYNAGALLTECVRRLAASTLPLDIVVADNASIDDSLAQLRAAAIADVAIVENGANLGFAKANNIALRDWDGDYALLLNPDCLIEPDSVEKVLAVMDAAPGAGMAGCLIRNPDGSEQAGCRRLSPTPGRVLKSMFGGTGVNLTERPLPAAVISVEAISGAFMLVRRSAMAQVGLLDEGYFMHCEDLDWCLRFRHAGWSILFVPDVAVTHVKGACSADNRVRVEWHKHLGMARYYRKFFRERYPLPLLWLVYLAIWTRFGAKASILLFRRPP
jgi:GT2 family glycosyltransferase